MSNPIKTEPESNSRKRTAEDREIEEWARKLASRPIPQFNPGQQVPYAELPANKGFDIDSAIGRFEWYKVGSTHCVPCLYRNGKKYCCLRIVETNVMHDLLAIIPKELYESAKLCSHHVTPAEAKLLNYINTWHCDHLYGSDNSTFTEKDLVVQVTEVEEFWKFLNFAFNVLSTSGENRDKDYSRCGFVHVNNENLIPYTILHSEPGEKGLPLFYFEGQVDILEIKAQPLSGWDLAYLKVCCKVQGVRKDLISGDTLKIVKLSDLKSYFPKRTTFKEECWPRSKGKALLPKQVLASLNKQNQNLVSSTVTSSSSTRTIVQSAPTKMAVAISSTNPTTVIQGPASILNLGSNSTLPVTAIPPVRRDLTIISVGNGPQRKGVSPLDKVPKVKASGPPTFTNTIKKIDEIPNGTTEAPYTLRLIDLETPAGNIPVVVINLKPSNLTQMIVLPPFLQLLSTSITKLHVPIYPFVVDLFRQLQIDIYWPNSAQIKAINKWGFGINHSWEMPMADYASVTQKLALIRSLFEQYSQNRLPNQLLQQQVRTNGSFSIVPPLPRR